MLHSQPEGPGTWKWKDEEGEVQQGNGKETSLPSGFARDSSSKAIGKES